MSLVPPSIAQIAHFWALLNNFKVRRPFLRGRFRLVEADYGETGLECQQFELGRRRGWHDHGEWGRWGETKYLFCRRWRWCWGDHNGEWGRWEILIITVIKYADGMTTGNEGGEEKPIICKKSTLGSEILTMNRKCNLDILQLLELFEHNTGNNTIQ
jgi:hypothetical protein